MKIKSAKFIKSIVGEDEILEDGKPQVAFIGRSNVGKSAVINSLVNSKTLARSSSTAGRTKEINLFLINNLFYLVDLPGYGYAKASLEDRENLRRLIYWYLLYSEVPHKKVVLIIDAKVGPTEYDLEMLRRLEDREKDIVVIANKIDKLKNSELKKQLQAIQTAIGKHKVLPYSAEKKIGIGELTALIT